MCVFAENIIHYFIIYPILSSVFHTMHFPEDAVAIIKSVSASFWCPYINRSARIDKRHRFDELTAIVITGATLSVWLRTWLIRPLSILSSSDFPLLPRTHVVPLWMDFREKTCMAVDGDHTTPLTMSYTSNRLRVSMVASRVPPLFVSISHLCLNIMRTIGLNLVVL